MHARAFVKPIVIKWPPSSRLENIYKLFCRPHPYSEAFIETSYRPASQIQDQ